MARMRAYTGWSKPICLMVVVSVLYLADKRSLTGSRLVQVAQAQQCETDNAALQSMQVVKLQFRFPDGREKRFQVKLADTNETRAAGFQHVCAATIAAQPILFVFGRETRPSFHMRNVVAPIDIAFIDRRGNIDSIRSMETYILGSKKRPLYSSRGSVVAALETHPGFYQQHGIDETVKVNWQSLQP